MNLRAVWFDLGGVLVELGAEHHLRSVLAEGYDAETFWPRWMASTAVRAHETGRMTAEDFAVAITREFGMTVSPDEFLAGFGSWVRGVHHGTLDLLHEVGQRHQTALLSNTCQAHWPVIEATGIPQAIQHVLPSFTVGEIKPDHAFFEKVMALTGTPAHEAVFFDDMLINVEAARQCGLTAFQVRHPSEARGHLVELGLLS